MDAQQFRIGLGYDVHRLEPGYALRLCGVPIPYHLGSPGHSDADTALHALCDALLGSLALGDIGALFPDTDPNLKGIDSTILLNECAGRVRCEGWEIANVDLVIMLQSPKLRPYIDTMRTRIAEVLQLQTNQVSVKATTTERLGFVGEGQGVACQAAVLVTRCNKNLR